MRTRRQIFFQCLVTVVAMAATAIVSQRSISQTSSEDCEQARLEIRAEIERLQSYVGSDPPILNILDAELVVLEKLVRKEKRCSSSAVTILTPNTANTQLGTPRKRPPPSELLNRLNRTHRSVVTPQENDVKKGHLDMDRLESTIELIRAELQKPSADGNKIRSLVSGMSTGN